MLDLNQAERFFESFTIRDRRTNRPVPFRLNPSQHKVMEACKAHVAKKHRLFVIFLKARRVGVSTIARHLQLAHAIEKDYSECLIMAHRETVCKSLYEEAHKITKQLPLRKESWKYTQREINFWNVHSKITWQTAGSVESSRGLGFTMLHFTEAAFVTNPDVFPAVFNTLSDDPENVVLVETTPNGKEGPGQAYYELWEATVRGDTEYLAQFLPWHDDPDYVRNPELAKDAPRDDYEKFLMKDLKLPKERIAFYRVTLASKCGGKLERWRKEFPGNPEEAFIAAGDPVFGFELVKGCEKWSIDTRFERIELKTFSHHRVEARDHGEGRFIIYERPVPTAHYFMGVVVGHAERGEDDADADDTLAMIVWNGETGVLAARYCMPLRQEYATEAVYALGCYFNKAMIACEDGMGGFGTTIFQRLRDHQRYPNQYKWKGRNDKADPSRSAQSLGFTITDFTRNMILNTLLTAIKRNECFTSDEMFTEQMPTVQRYPDGRFEAIADFDEVFWAGALGWMAKDQWHPRKCEGYKGEQDFSLWDEAIKKIPHQKSPLSTEGGILTMTLQHHLDTLKQKEQQRAQEENYGIEGWGSSRTGW